MSYWFHTRVYDIISSYQMRISYAETHHVYNIPILKVLLLEGINPVATNVFENTGYEVFKIELWYDHTIKIVLGHQDLKCIKWRWTCWSDSRLSCTWYQKQDSCH